MLCAIGTGLTAAAAEAVRQSSALLRMLSGIPKQVRTRHDAHCCVSERSYPLFPLGLLLPPMPGSGLALASNLPASVIVLVLITISLTAGGCIFPAPCTLCSVKVQPL